MASKRWNFSISTIPWWNFARHRFLRIGNNSEQGLFLRKHDKAPDNLEQWYLHYLYIGRVCFIWLSSGSKW